MQDKVLSLEDVIALARMHAGRDKSKMALICVNDAVYLQERGEPEYAMRSAVRSLAYSVGCGHKDFRAAAQAQDAQE